MISPRQPPPPAAVARHYDELDAVYRHAWGDHLHHGYWDDAEDRRGSAAATIRLLEELTAPLRPRPGDHYADIGSGYGAPARWLAARHGIHVTALTISTRQAAHARRAPAPMSGSVDYLLGDWLCNNLAEASLDGALAVEVLSHVGDKASFLRQLHRTLKPGARAVLALWTVADRLAPLERPLLRHLCADGHLAGIATLAAYRRLATASGLRVVSATDVSKRVERTWQVITRRSLTGLLTRRCYWRLLAGRLFRRRALLLTLPAVRLAYRTGALRYAFLTVERPPGRIAESPGPD